jgi:MFS family permease
MTSIQSYMRAVRLIHRDAWKLMLVPIVVGFGYGGIYAVVFNLYLLRLGYGVEFVGLLGAVSLLLSAAGGIPAGIVGRRWGLRFGVLGGYWVWLAANLLIPLAEWLPLPWRSVGLLAIWSMAWIGAGLYGVNRVPYLAGLTSPQERSHTFAISTALSGMAAVVGSLFAGFLPGWIAGWTQSSLDSAAPYRYALLLPPLLYLLTLPALHSIRDVQIVRNNQAGPAARAPVMLMAVVALVITLLMASQSAATTFFNVYMDEHLGVSTATIGILIATGQMLSVAAALGAPLLTARWGNFRTFVGAALGLALGALALAASAQWLAAGLGYMVVIALFAIVQPVKAVFHQEIISPEWRSPMSGAANMAEKVGRALMAGIGGFLIVRLGYQSMFLVAALLTLSGAIFLWGYFRRPNEARAGEVVKI